MKKALIILLFFIPFLTLSQKKRDTLPPTKHNHALAFEFLGAAGLNYGVGYEYWFRKGLNGFGISTGVGIKGYRRGLSRIGETMNGYFGVYYTVGKWMGLRIGANLSGEINPGAYTGKYHSHGKPISYPLSDEDYWALPGDPIKKWMNNFSFDIGPYFTFWNGEFTLYLKFSYGYFKSVSYWFWPDRASEYDVPYGGVTLKFDMRKIHDRIKLKKAQRER